MKITSHTLSCSSQFNIKVEFRPHPGLSLVLHTTAKHNLNFVRWNGHSWPRSGNDRSGEDPFAAQFYLYLISESFFCGIYLYICIHYKSIVYRITCACRFRGTAYLRSRAQPRRDWVWLCWHHNILVTCPGRNEIILCIVYLECRLMMNLPHLYRYKSAFCMDTHTRADTW